MAGIIKLSLLTEGIFEWGSIFVLEAFRGRHLSTLLVRHLLDHFTDRAIVVISNVPRVITICKHLNQTELLRGEISREFLEIIE